MRDDLPSTPLLTEVGILNLDGIKGQGSHWVAYKKKGRSCHYFDSYGELKPFKSFVRYMKNCNITYNTTNYQKNHPYSCGHWCLKFLLGLVK